MSWDALGGEYFVSRSDLQDAVDKGYFLINAGVPGTDVNKFVTYNEANSYVQLDDTKIPTGKGDWWAQKQFLVGVFPSIVTNFSNLATPRKAIYNTNNGKIYYIDYDDQNFGVWYFDPLTAQSNADFHGVPGTVLISGTDVSFHLTDIVFSVAKNKIYVHGEYGNGLIIIDCSTNNVTNTVSYGNNGLYQRQQLEIVGNNIWAFDATYARYEIISLDSESIIGNFELSSVPGYNSHASSEVKFINSKIWFLLTSSTVPSLIRVYNNVDVPNYTSDLIHSIDNIGSIDSFNSKIEISEIYNDADNNAVYVPSSGDKEVYVYNSVDYSLLNTISIDTEGKGYISLLSLIRTTTNQLYLSGTLLDSVNDATRKLRTYEVNRTTYSIANVQNNVQYSSLIYAANSELNYATIPGFNYLDAGSHPEYLTDGLIIGLN